MGCPACARARVPGLVCVAGACQQRTCAGPLSFRKIADYPILLSDDRSDFLGADMNRDGRLDLIGYPYDNRNREVSVWLGQGDGTFVVSKSYPTVGDFETPKLPGYAAVGDFNEDGLVDLVVTEHEDRSAAWIRPGLPGGGFAGRPGVSAPRQLVADLDGDCHLDFVTASDSDNDDSLNTEVLVLRGRGNGTFASPRKIPIRDEGLPMDLVDWNGDGILDILFRGSVLHILQGKGDGSFAEDQRCPVSAGPVGTTVFADLNQDGRFDMLLPMGDRLGTVLGQGGCRFTQRTDYPSLSTGAYALGDLDSDGLSDLLGAGPTTALLTGSADGKLTRQPDLAIDSSGFSNVLIADVNSDGRADLVLTGLNRGIQVFANTCAE
jgi:hypothetical protein